MDAGDFANATGIDVHRWIGSNTSRKNGSAADVAPAGTQPVRGLRYQTRGAVAAYIKSLTEQFDGYLRQYQRAFIAAIENLWSKYALTTKQILAERDQEAAQLDAFLKELGYE